VIHQVERNAANPDPVRDRGVAVGALDLRAPQRQVVVHGAHRDLDAVESKLLRHGECVGLAAHA
jgi:hypothetical protein